MRLLTGNAVLVKLDLQWVIKNSKLFLDISDLLKFRPVALNALN